MAGDLAEGRAAGQYRTVDDQAGCDTDSGVGG